MSSTIPAIEPQERVSPTSNRIYGVVCRKDPVKRIAFLRRNRSAKANAGKYKVYFVSDACKEFDLLEVGYVVKFTLRPTPRGARAEKVCWTGEKIFWQASKPQLDEARRTQSTPQPKPSAQQEAPPRVVTPTTSPLLTAAPQRPTTATENSVRREPGELGSAPSDTLAPPGAPPAPPKFPAQGQESQLPKAGGRAASFAAAAGAKSAQENGARYSVRDPAAVNLATGNSQSSGYTVPTALPAPANAHLSNAQQQGGDPSGVAHGSGTTPESTDGPSENPEEQSLQPLDSSQPAADGQVLAGHESARENKEKIERLRKELKQAEAEGRQLAASTKGQLLDECQGNIRSFALFPAVKSLMLAPPPDDGEREIRVAKRLIRKFGGGSDSFREGDKVEADYRGRGKFYPGKISRDRGDDTYDIDYKTDWTDDDVPSIFEGCATNFKVTKKPKKGFLLEFDSSEDAREVQDRYKDKCALKGCALKWNMNGYSEQIEVLAEMAKREPWYSKGEDGTVRPVAVLKNYVEMSFKIIAAHQPDKLMFSEDGKWAAFDTRLRTPIDNLPGLQKIYAVFQETGKGDVPYYFKGWHTWGTGPTNNFGGEPPEALSTENPNPNIEVPKGWKSFKEEYEFPLDDKHIIVDNFERVRKICTPSETPQDSPYLFLGNPQESAARAFFRNEGFDIVDEIVATNQVKLHPLGRRAMNLVYAEFESAVDAAAMEKKCRDEKKKIGDTRCKPVLSQGPPSESEVRGIADKLQIALGHAIILARDNPQCVLPQLFLPGNNIKNGFIPQLLLPLHLCANPVADAALAVEIKADGSECGWFYHASTILTLDMALNNARLIGSLDTQWLREAVQAAESDPQAFNATVTAPETPSLVPDGQDVQNFLH